MNQASLRSPSVETGLWVQYPFQAAETLPTNFKNTIHLEPHSLRRILCGSKSLWRVEIVYWQPIWRCKASGSTAKSLFCNSARPASWHRGQEGAALVAAFYSTDWLTDWLADRQLYPFSINVICGFLMAAKNRLGWSWFCDITISSLIMASAERWLRYRVVVILDESALGWTGFYGFLLGIIWVSFSMKKAIYKWCYILTTNYDHRPYKFGILW